MIKYKIEKEYSAILNSIEYQVYRREFLIFWFWVDYRNSRDAAERLIKLLEDNDL